jgi:hypothetical protein
MPKGPKDAELKMEQMINAWETLAPTKKFGGMSLDEFKAFAVPCQESRRLIETLTDQLGAAINTRDAADEVIAEKEQLVVSGVLADPTEGPDSSIYEAFGYTRKSERKSGLTRKGGTPPPPTPAPRGESGSTEPASQTLPENG